MALDASIYGQLDTQAPLRLSQMIREANNPMAQAQQMLSLKQMLQSGQLHELQMQKARQEMADSDATKQALSALYGGAQDPAARQALARTAPLAYQKFVTQEADLQAKKANAAKDTLGVTKQIMTQAFANPTQESALGAISRIEQITGQDMSAEKQRVATLGADPKAIQMWAAGHALEAEKLLPKVDIRDLGGAHQAFRTNPVTGEIVQGEGYAKSATPDAVMTDARARAEGAANRAVALRGQNLTNARAMAQLAFDKERTAQKTEDGKPLPSAAIAPLSAAGTAVEDSRRMAGTFKDEYGGKTVLGDMSNTYKRLVGDATGQAQWWQDFEMHQNQTRHALFGSALTAIELAAWNKTAVSPRMAPEEIKKNLARREEIEARAASKLARAYKAGGYNQAQIGELLGSAAEYLDRPAPPAQQVPQSAAPSINGAKFLGFE